METRKRSALTCNSERVGRGYFDVDDSAAPDGTRGKGYFS